MLLAAGLAAGCKIGGDQSLIRQKRTVNAGPASQFIDEGIYANFRDDGFFVIRADGKLFVLSSCCTHRRCTLTAQPGRCFLCPCHGSTFDFTGHVTTGPARRDLPVLPARVDADANLLVEISGL